MDERRRQGRKNGREGYKRNNSTENCWTYCLLKMLPSHCNVRQIVLLVILVRQIVCGNISRPPATNLQRPIRSVFFAYTTLALFSARKLLFQRFYVKFSVTTTNVLVFHFSISVGFNYYLEWVSIPLKLGPYFFII